MLLRAAQLFAGVSGLLLGLCTGVIAVPTQQPVGDGAHGALARHAQYLFTRSLVTGSIECIIDASRRLRQCDPDATGRDGRFLSPNVSGPFAGVPLDGKLANSFVPPVMAVPVGPMGVVNVAIVPANILGPLGSATPIAFNTILAPSIVGSQLHTVLAGANNSGPAILIAGLAPGAALPMGPVALSGATYAESGAYLHRPGYLTGRGIYSTNPYANLGAAGAMFGMRR